MLKNHIYMIGPRGKLKLPLSINFLQCFNVIQFSRPLSWPEIVKFKQGLIGVSLSYSLELVLRGVGFRVDNIDNKLVFRLGYSHGVVIGIPSIITVRVVKNTIYLSSVALTELKNFSSQIRQLKMPDRYKGQGIVYKNEVLLLKEGKKT